MFYLERQGTKETWWVIETAWRDDDDVVWVKQNGLVYVDVDIDKAFVENQIQTMHDLLHDVYTEYTSNSAAQEPTRN